MKALALPALLLACSGPVDDCEHGVYRVDATQLDGKCGALNPIKAHLDCTTSESTGSTDYIAENGEPRVLTWEDWYDIGELVGGSTMRKWLPEKTIDGDTGAWGTAAEVSEENPPLCESHYSLTLTRL